MHTWPSQTFRIPAATAHDLYIYHITLKQRLQLLKLPKCKTTSIVYKKTRLYDADRFGYFPEECIK